MTALPGKHTSVWLDTVSAPRYPALTGDHSADVAIVGGGIVGLTAALLLKRAGRRVAVIDSQRVAAQVTARSTAKVTSQHGLIYAELIKSLGEDGARVYADANQAAIERIAGFVAELGITCDFERTAAYVYGPSDQDLPALRAEVEAAGRLGLPASFTTETSLPFAIAGAIRFADQAQFHPYKYLLPIAEAIAGDGSALFEETRVLDVKEETPCRILTDRGTVTARDVIVATNLPILDRGGFFARAFPRAHLVMAARIDPANAPDGMFLGAGTPAHSIRTAPYQGGRLLIVAGPGFRPGHDADTTTGYRDLELFVRSEFEIQSIDYRWMNQDYDSMDRVPYVGRLLPTSRHVFVATGFNAWGITNGTVAGTILSDAILGRPNPWAEIFRTTRLNPAVSAKSFVQGNLHVARRWIMDRWSGARRPTLAALKPGEGAVVEVDGKRLAAYRDEQGALHAVSPVCTHLGCDVAWNNAEATWDCACHGSRFSREGRVIHGPAVKDLEPRAIPAEAPVKAAS